MTIGNQLRAVGVREARANLRTLVEQVADGAPAGIMTHNRPVAVLLRSDEAERWQRIEHGLAALHGLEIYPELASDTSQLAGLVRGDVRPAESALRRLARQRREILSSAEYVGLADVRVRFASLLEKATKGRPVMVVGYGHPRAILISFDEYRRLIDLSRTIRWFQAAGLDLRSAQPGEVVDWLTAFRERRVAADDAAAGA